MSSEITRWLGQLRSGDREALDRLVPLLYDELRGLARRLLDQERPGHTLTPTSLVHEAYLRFVRPGALAVNDRAHFFAVAARAMRQIAVDHARERLAAKRGGGLPDTTLGAADRVPADDDGRHDQMVALNEALDALEAADARLARLVELRFFAGMSLEEAGELLGLSPTTLKRDFRKARAFLHARLGAETLDEPGT